MTQTAPATAGKPIDWWKRLLIGLPAWPVILLAVLVLLIQLWIERIPSRSGSGTPLWQNPALLFAWLLIAAWAVFVLVIGSRVPREFGRRRVSMWLVPALLVVAVIASAANWGFRAAFAMSGPTLDAYAQSAISAFPTLDWKPEPLGVFQPQQILATQRVVFIRIHDGLSFVYVAPGEGKSELNVAGVPAWAGKVIETLPAKNWYLTDATALSPASQHDAALEDISQALLAGSDSKPQSVHFLLDSVGKISQPVILAYPWTPPATNPASGPVDPYDSSFGTIPGNMRTITRMGATAVEDLHAALIANPALPVNYIAALGLLGGAAAPAAPEIAPYLKDPDAHVRATTAWALGRMGRAGTAQGTALLAAFEDEDPTVQFNARVAIKSSGFDAGAESPWIILRWHKLIFRNDSATNHYLNDLVADDSRRFLVDLIVKAGASASSAQSDAAAQIAESIAFFQSHPKSQDDAGGKIAAMRASRELAINEAARMLWAIGPSARPQANVVAQALSTVVRDHLGMHHADELDTVTDPKLGKPFPGPEANLDQPLVHALSMIDPLDQSISQLLVTYLSQSRNGALVDPANTDKDETDRPSYFFRRDLARLVQRYDPENATIRQQLRRDFRAAVNSPERRWAVDLSRLITMPPAELTPVLRPMLATGDDRSATCAAQAAAFMGKDAGALAPELVAWLKKHQGVDGLLLQTQLADALAADPDSILKQLPSLMDSSAAEDHHFATMLIARLGAKADSPDGKTVQFLRAQLKAAISADTIGKHDAYTELVLQAIKSLGPAAKAAVPDLLPLLTKGSDRDLSGVFWAIFQTGPSPEADAAVEKFIADGKYPWTDTPPAGAGPRLLPLLLKAPTPHPEAIFNLAAHQPLALSVLKPFIAGDNADPVAAILGATDANPAKAAALIDILKSSHLPAAQIAAAEGLVKLHITTPAAHEALLACQVGSAIQNVRSACATANKALFPGS